MELVDGAAEVIANRGIRRQAGREGQRFACLVPAPGKGEQASAGRPIGLVVDEAPVVGERGGYTLVMANRHRLAAGATYASAVEALLG